MQSKIDGRKAVGILRRENPNHIQWLMKLLHEGEALCLRSGAKLYRCSPKQLDPGYYISGYAYDGSDVTAYVKGVSNA